MSFTIRLIILILFLILVEFYFTKKAAGSIKKLFPKIPKQKIKKITLWGLIWLNLFPLAMFTVWIYARIAQTESIRHFDNFFYEYLILYPFWIWILIVIQGFVLLLPLDIIKFILYWSFKKWRDKLRSVHTKIVFVVVIGAAVYVPVRVIFDLNTVSTRIVEYAKEDLHESLEDFRITLIADVQADQFTTPSKLQNYIDEVNATDPDLVLIAGDIVTSTPNYLPTAAEYIGKIKSRYGVYSCVGDHDNWMYYQEYERSVREVTEALENINVKMIDNDKVTIDVDSAKIGITFITYTYVERIDSVSLDSLTNGTTGYDLRIFLTHQPRKYLIDEAIEKNYDLMFAGHTHGGQITILFPFHNFTPSHIETDFVKGDFWFDDMLMVVNRGLGVSLAPVRYNATPEVTSIVIRGK
ncbi:metallophosphoesterase [Bacteroidota bacterium]